MRAWLALLILTMACASPPPEGAQPIETPPPERALADLEFNDAQLQAIARELVATARARGIETSRGHNRVERLLALEAELGAAPRAVTRVNDLVNEMIATDFSRWAKIRRRADRAFADDRDPAAARVADLLQRWERRKMETAISYLSSNYASTVVPPLEWERRFHEFAAASPQDAATWGWIVSGACATTVREQFGEADARRAYEYYVASSGFGGANDVRRLFSFSSQIPGTPPPAKFARNARGFHDRESAEQRCSPVRQWALVP